MTDCGTAKTLSSSSARAVPFWIREYVQVGVDIRVLLEIVGVVWVYDQILRILHKLSVGGELSHPLCRNMGKRECLQGHLGVSIEREVRWTAPR
jgi:hypothetical protein